MPRKKHNLSPEEKAANVAAGLTPLGFVPKPRTRGEDKAPTTPKVDYYKTAHTPFTVARKNMFLVILKKGGEPALAAMDVGISLDTAYRHRGADPLFRDAWDEALRQHAGIYAKEMIRRGVEGWDEPVFGSLGKDSGVGIIGHVRKYSDRLLIEQARKHDPGYTPKSQIQSTVEHVGAGIDLSRLSPASQDQLREILERELANVRPPEDDDPE